MKTLLTSSEAAAAAGIAPSTFRAYVARGQAPKPRQRVGNANLWALSDLRNWRKLPPTVDAAESSDEWLVYASTRLSRGRHWEESTCRDLAQVGLSYSQALDLIAGNAPGGLSVQTYQDARYILDVRVDLRRRLARLDGEAPSAPAMEDDLLAETARRVAAGEDMFEVKADLTVQLVRRGFPERLSPLHFDRRFWTSQDDEADLLDYLREMETVDLPQAGC